MMEILLSRLAESFDLPILDWIACHLHCSFLDRVIPYVTLLGDGGILWILFAIAMLLLPKHRRTGLGIVFSLVIGLLVCNAVLKPLIARPRPFDYQLLHFGKTVSLLIEVPRDFSFPSGHTIASFEAAAVLLLNNKKLGIAGLVLASLIAFSRLYLYVHYPTDVIASIILGIMAALVGDHLAKRVFPLLHTDNATD